MKNASFGILFCILLCCFFILTAEKNKETKVLPKIEFKKGMTVEVFDPAADTVTKMQVEEYVWRCVAKEMPAAFHAEAIKAQAVAARSYLLHKLAYSPNSHPKGDICTDFNCCAAFLTDESTLLPEHRYLFQQATKATEGQVLFYKEEIANAVFHAMSAGKTENARDVWSKSVPYLVAVDSGLDKNAEKFETQIEFPTQEIFDKLEITSLTLSKPSSTPSGTVKQIQIGGKTFTGQEVRKRLNLRSAAFGVQQTEAGLRFTVYGYGHGVGMSQTGADLYAREGLDYTQILEKYYTGTKVALYY